MFKIDTRRFEADIAKFAEQVKIAPELVVRKLALDIFTDLLRASPVDTGRFRANWTLSLGTPNRRILWAMSDIGKQMQAQINLAAKRVQQADGTQVIYITNNLPYAERLNEGWSQQAPAGFVQMAIAKNVKPIADVVGAAA
jgi:hypothetical protein